MRRYLTLGITSTGKTEIIDGPDKPYGEHRDEFRKLGSGKKKKDAPKGYAEIQIAEITVIKRKRYSAVKLKGEAATGKRTVARTVDSKGKRHEVDTGAAHAAAKKAARASRKTAATKTTARKVGAKTAARRADADAAAQPTDEGIFGGTSTEAADGPTLG